MLRARLFSPSKTAMSSGMARTRGWVLDFVAEEDAETDPLMGWTGSSDTQKQVRLRFKTREEALDYAEENGIELISTQPTRRSANIRAGGYGENFATNRRRTWTH